MHFCGADATRHSKSATIPNPLSFCCLDPLHPFAKSCLTLWAWRCPEVRFPLSTLLWNLTVKGLRWSKSGSVSIFFDCLNLTCLLIGWRCLMKKKYAIFICLCLRMTELMSYLHIHIMPATGVELMWFVVPKFSFLTHIDLCLRCACNDERIWKRDTHIDNMDSCCQVLWASCSTWRQWVKSEVWTFYRMNRLVFASGTFLAIVPHLFLQFYVRWWSVLHLVEVLENHRFIRGFF